MIGQDFKRFSSEHYTDMIYNILRMILECIVQPGEGYKLGMDRETRTIEVSHPSNKKYNLIITVRKKKPS